MVAEVTVTESFRKTANICLNFEFHLDFSAGVPTVKRESQRKK